MNLLLTTFLLVVPVLLLHEKDENLSENLDEVNEEIQGVGNEVLVSVPGLPDDQLCVEHDEATEDSQTDPNVCLEQELGPEENIDEAKPDEGGQTRAQHSSQVEILPVRGHQWSSGEAGEDCGGDKESRGDDAGVHHDGQLEKGSHAKTSQKSKSQQHGHSGASVLAVIRSHKETKSQSSRDQGVENPPATEEISAEVDIGPSRGGQHSHGEAGVDILQVSPDMRLKFRIEGVEEVVNSRHFFLSAN